MADMTASFEAVAHSQVPGELFSPFFKKLKIESCALQSAFILLSLCFENQL